MCTSLGGTMSKKSGIEIKSILYQSNPGCEITTHTPYIVNPSSCSIHIYAVGVVCVLFLKKRENLERERERDFANQC